LELIGATTDRRLGDYRQVKPRLQWVSIRVPAAEEMKL